MISVTPAAADAIRTLAAEQDKQDTGLRVMIVGGGCSGLTYAMGFEDAEQEGDEIIESEGLKIFVDVASQMYLDGTTIDFVEQYGHGGFQFDNPNPLVQHTCGCSGSH